MQSTGVKPRVTMNTDQTIQHPYLPELFMSVNNLAMKSDSINSKEKMNSTHA